MIEKFNQKPAEFAYIIIKYKKFVNISLCKIAVSSFIIRFKDYFAFGLISNMQLNNSQSQSIYVICN